MSQENVEATYRVFDAFNRRDIDAYLALMDDDVEAVSRLVAMEGDYHGHDGIRRWWNTVLDVFPDYSGEVVEMRDLGDVTFAASRLGGHGAGSAAPTDEVTWMMARWRRGKCVWWRFFRTRAEAFEAVGLSEQDAHADS